MNKVKLVILSGLPASGKTTHARDWVNQAPKQRVRVNRDDIRRMCGPYWIPQREDLITKIEWNNVIAALDKDYDVILDATNFKLKKQDQVKSKLRARGLEKDLDNVLISFKFIDTPLEVCLERDKEREQTVGEDVIMRMYNSYLKEE